MVHRPIIALLEGPVESKTRSEDNADIYVSKDKREYIVVILEGFKQDGIIYEEKAEAIFGTKEYLGMIEVGDKLAIDS